MSTPDEITEMTVKMRQAFEYQNNRRTLVLEEQLLNLQEEIIRLSKIEAAAKALISWPTGKAFFSDYWDELLEALEGK